jgi:hypothetical protein
MILMQLKLQTLLLVCLISDVSTRVTIQENPAGKPASTSIENPEVLSMILSQLQIMPRAKPNSDSFQHQDGKDSKERWFHLRGWIVPSPCNCQLPHS